MMAGHHKCGAPGCLRRILGRYFCCAQHRMLLGFHLSCAMQTAWQERNWDPAKFPDKRKEYEARLAECVALWKLKGV